MTQVFNICDAACCVPATESSYMKMMLSKRKYRDWDRYIVLKALQWKYSISESSSDTPFNREEFSEMNLGSGEFDAPENVFRVRSSLSKEVSWILRTNAAKWIKFDASPHIEGLNRSSEYTGGRIERFVLSMTEASLENPSERNSRDKNMIHLNLAANLRNTRKLSLMEGYLIVRDRRCSYSRDKVLCLPAIMGVTGYTAPSFDKDDNSIETARILWQHFALHVFRENNDFSLLHFAIWNFSKNLASWLADMFDVDEFEHDYEKM
ncbi:hypothetical protein HK100_011062 [Physocladia obscura]|uniref:Uncharacterized protein n=1 Tax=Physocladia obscura TaxID=109957 RepID=A0AAD5T3N9_9FUNG|nr:hypothetical protein HK100_011062 [Physocladia obscura]